MDRFLIEKRTEAGGMGQIYRALDLHTEHWVALKLLRRAPRHDELARFLREAQTLSALRHPGIVAYVAHGISREQSPYLAMEWLDGYDLRQRLGQRALSVEEVVALLFSVTEALSAAHSASVVHRDLKPSNLFLRDGRLDLVTLIDFGLARRIPGGPGVTKTGSVIGTPEYMAPEQARGDRQVGPSADIFSLGCVLFECLTGQPPFCHEHVTAVMAKILFEDPPLLAQLRPDLPKPLASLIQRMLIKNKQSRIADAMVLRSELQEKLHRGDGARTVVRSDTSTAQSPALKTEQVLVSMVLAQRLQPGSQRLGEAEEVELRRNQLALVRDELSRLCAKADCMEDGSVIATVSQQGAPTEQAISAVRCALTLSRNYPDCLIGIATGRAVLLGEDGVMGDVTSKLSRMLESVIRLPNRPQAAIFVDEATSRLAKEHFRLLPLSHQIWTLEKPGLSELSPLLSTRNSQTPWVGRERELGLLTSLFLGCRDNSQSTVALVTGPTGMGKSRLCREFLSRISTEPPDDVLLLLGRGEPIGSGASYGLLGHVLRQSMDVRDGDDPALRREKISAAVRQLSVDADPLVVATFLGEICGTPFPENPALRAARLDLRIMADRTASALVSFLAALTKTRTVVLVLEDLHWGDTRTCHLIDVALRELQDRRLMVLGLARPEIEELFPSLFAERSRQDIRLAPLSRKACERLIEQVMGEPPSSPISARILEQSAGNALFLEELMRAVMEGRGDELPETVFAVLHARLMRLPPDARRAVRAASVFGETFWDGGVCKLLGIDREADGIASWLHALLEAEIISRHRESRIPSAVQYGFRHALVREAAYEMLTGEERRAAHYQAGCYLESVGASDAVLLAEHFERGGDDARAVPYYVRAVELSFESSNLDGILRYAARGVVCGAKGEPLGILRSFQATAWFWRTELEQALEAGREAIHLLGVGSSHWLRATSYATVCAAALGKRNLVSELSPLLGTIAPASDCIGNYVESVVAVLLMLGMIGDRETAERYLFHIDRTASKRAVSDPYVRAWMYYGMGRHASALQPMPGSAIDHYRTAIEAFREFGDRRMTAVTLSDLGLALGRLGRTDEAESAYREGLLLAPKIGDVTTTVWVEMFYALLLAERSDAASVHESSRMAQSIIDRIGTNSYYSGFALCALSACHAAKGNLADAEATARSALAILRPLRSSAPTAHQALGRALLSANRIPEAIETLSEGIALIESLRGSGGSELPLRLLFLSSLRSGGQDQRALIAQRAFLDQLSRRLVDVSGDEQRDSYLERHSEANARKLIY